MARPLLNKRLNEAESKVRRVSRNRNEAEARNVTPARLEEIMLEWDAKCRDGIKTSATYLDSLTSGELLRAIRERDQWVQKRAKQLEPEHFAKLKADGVEAHQWTEAELTAYLSYVKEDSNIDWRSVPKDVLRAIGDGTGQITDEELSRMYPNRSSR